MDPINEYGLSTVKSIPIWIARIPFLKRLWFNPVFQRNYRNSQVKKLIYPKLAFRAGLIWSAIISVIMLIVTAYDHDELASDSACFIIAFLFAIMYGITFFRMFIFCLVTTPRELQQDIGKDNLSSILTTPLSDGSLFFAETLPNFVRGLEVIQSLLYLFIGLVIPLFLSLWLVGMKWLPTFKIEYILSVLGTTIITLIYMILALVLMMLVISLVSGAYAITHNIFGAIMATLLQTFLIAIISGVAMVTFHEYLTWSVFRSYGLNFREEFIIYVSTSIIGILIVYWSCLITSYFGISAFAKVRRQGYYKPEMSNAAGLE